MYNSNNQRTTRIIHSNNYISVILNKHSLRDNLTFRAAIQNKPDRQKAPSRAIFEGWQKLVFGEFVAVHRTLSGNTLWQPKHDESRAYFFEGANAVYIHLMLKILRIEVIQKVYPNRLSGVNFEVKL